MNFDRMLHHTRSIFEVVRKQPISERTEAAVATGEVWWICRARSVRARVDTAAAFTKPSLEMARTS